MGVVWGVGRLGFEPRTLGLKVRCSDQTELPARRGMPVSRARLRLAGRLSGHGASFYYTTEPSSGWLRCGAIRSVRGRRGRVSNPPLRCDREGGHVGPPLRPYGREVRRDDQCPADGHVGPPLRPYGREVRRDGQRPAGGHVGPPLRPYGREVRRDDQRPAGGHVGLPQRCEGRADRWVRPYGVRGGRTRGSAPTAIWPGSPTGRSAPGGRTRGTAPTV